MVTGQTYAQDRDWIVAHWRLQIMGYEWTDAWLAERGLSSPILDWFLAEHGYVWRKVYIGWEPNPWPPEPFAPVHIAQVIQPSGNSHFVILQSDGLTLDPMSDEPRRLTDWERVNFVQGIWTLGGDA